MTRPLSQLTFNHLQYRDGGPRIVGFHPHNAFSGSIRDLIVPLSPGGRVVALQSAKGVYTGREIGGYTWFVGPLDQPSPIHFGDSLAEIERFLWDEVDRQTGGLAELPFLVGIEQGAIMALAAAAAVPDLLSGVVAIDGQFPDVPGWTPPLAPLNGLPSLLVDPVRPSSAEKITLAERLASWGASVAVTSQTNGPLATTIKTWIDEQPIRTMSRS